MRRIDFGLRTIKAEIAILIRRLDALELYADSLVAPSESYYKLSCEYDAEPPRQVRLVEVTKTISTIRAAIANHQAEVNRLRALRYSIEIV